MQVTTRAQRLALYRVYRRAPADRRASYLAFRRTARLSWGCLMVPWCGMWLGIEEDGYTHS